ncbi:MAG: LacI family DNA-binding transcriptional regulator [Melioribacteraceae bacterium]|nr:LacI family DNA-binding transcriptional regulator [Melioribacteraceae bacterium]
MLRTNKQITLNDIATRLNVSKVTVSKALRDHPDISEKRTKEIKAAASELGYIPNFAARNLSSKKTRTIGVVVPAIANSFFANFIESIYDCAFENNYDIILAVSQENSQKELKQLETMLSMRVDGIIISVAELSENKEILKRIKKSEIPLVFFDRSVEYLKFSSVILANQTGAFSAIEKAIEKGYRKIGHIAGWQNSNIGRDRFLGYKEALQKHKITSNKDWVVFSGFGKKDGYNSFKEMYKKNNLPEILFAVTFPVALGILEAAKEVGVKIPSDLDLICFGDSELNEYLKPKISCVTHDTSDFAKQTFKLIMKQIESKEQFIDEHVEIETKMLMNETCIKKQFKISH